MYHGHPSKPELRAVWEDSLSKPLFGVTSAIICPDPGGCQDVATPPRMKFIKNNINSYK